MSQVIVEDDEYRSKRQESAIQEHRIDSKSLYHKWQNHGTFGLAPVAKIAGIAFAPVAAFWVGLTFLVTAVFNIIGRFFSLIGRLWGAQS